MDGYNSLRGGVSCRQHGAVGIGLHQSMDGESISFRSLLNRSAPRNEVEARTSHRHKRKNSHREDCGLPCDEFGEYTRCKRFASEEEVTVHLQQLNLSKSTCDDISTCYRSPRHDLNYDPSQFSPPGSSDPQNVLQPTNHSLLITALTGCPGLLQDESDNQGDHMRVGHVTRESERSPPNTLSTSVMLTDQLPWQQTYVCECTGQQSFLRDEQVITPLRLIDDTSSCRSNNWSLTGGDEVSPPLGAVRPQPESITGLTGLTTFDTDMEFPVLDQLKATPLQLTNQILDDTNTISEDPMADAPDCTSWPSNTNDVITSNYPSGCYERRGQPPSLPTTETAWRQLDVTFDDVSSDSSDGGVDSPERPLSVWLSPELLHYSTSSRHKDHPLPQCLLERYRNPVGMQLVPWVDRSTRLASGCEHMKYSKNEEEMIEEVESVDDRGNELLDNDDSAMEP